MVTAFFMTSFKVEPHPPWLEPSAMDEIRIIGHESKDTNLYRDICLKSTCE
jgi:hypothetical protein